MRPVILVLFVVSLAVVQDVFAEREEWFPGDLLLKSQTKLQGEIWVRVDYNIVLFREGAELIIYPAHKVLSVSVYDKSTDEKRNFISLQLEMGAATVHQLYEVLLDGQFSVLRRERILWYSVHLDKPEHDYFVWDGTEMFTLYHFRRKILPKLIKSSNENVRSLIRSHHLKPNRLEDTIAILGYYNQYQMSESQLAKKE